MSKFNSKNTNKGMNGLKPTTNHEGAVVHKLTSLEVLFSKVLGSLFGESTYYEKRSALDDFAKLKQLVSEISDNDKEYILKIAELGRSIGMIQYPLEVLTVAYNDDRFKGQNFKDEKGRNKLRYYSDVIVRRTKDINEILASHFANYGRNTGLPKQMRVNLTSKLESYDQYKLSKGLDSNSEVSLADTIKMLRPKPENKEMGLFYKNIIEGNVVLGDNKKQIQTELVKKGQTKTEDNKDLTKALYQANLQALLKHLFNLLKNGVFEDKNALEYAVKKITDKKTILSAKLLPYQFYTAYRTLKSHANTPQVLALTEAVEEALEISIENVDTIEGMTAILIDKSGSMTMSSISSNSSVSAAEIAMLLGAIAFKKGTADLFVFANRTERVNVSRKAPIFTIVDSIKQLSLGGGTDIKTAFEYITNHAKSYKLQYDNLIVLSDNDCYGYDSRKGYLSFGDSWSKDNSDAHVNRMIKDGIIKKVWINNLVGNNFAIVNTNQHTKNLITGFSEKFINIINVYNYLGTGKDIRKVIDLLLEKERMSNK